MCKFFKHSQDHGRLQVDISKHALSLRLHFEHWKKEHKRHGPNDGEQGKVRGNSGGSSWRY